MGENLTSLTEKSFRDPLRAGIACCGVEQLLLCLGEPSTTLDCPCDGQDVIPALSQCSMQGVARCFSMAIPGRHTAGSTHDQEEQPQLAGCELGWTLQVLLLSVSHGRERHFGHLLLPVLVQFSPSGQSWQCLLWL